MCKCKYGNCQYGSSEEYETPEMVIWDLGQENIGTKDIIVSSPLNGNGNFTEETKPGDTVIDGWD